MPDNQFAFQNAPAQASAEGPGTAKKTANTAQIGPKKTVHAAPVIKIKHTVDEMLKRADGDIEAGFFDLAKDEAGQVIAQEPDNCHALIIMLMADMKVNDVDQLKEQPRPLETSPYYQRIIDTGDASYAGFLREANRVICDKLNENWKEEMDKVRYALHQAQVVPDVRAAEEILKEIPSFPASDELRDECRQKREELTPDTYELAMTRMSEYKWDKARFLFKSIEGYKQSGIYITECQESQKKEELYQTAREYEDQGKFREAYEAFISLGSYRHSKAHADKAKRYIRGKKVRVVGKKHTGAAFVNTLLAVFYSIGCGISCPGSFWINMLWGVPLVIVSLVLSILRSRFKNPKRLWLTMGITFAAFIALISFGGITYGSDDAVFSSIFYFLATVALLI